MIFRKKDAVRVNKAGVDMWIYAGADALAEAGVAYQETRVGHGEEFRHDKSAFIYFIIEGAGEWVIEDERFPVAASDVVVVPPGKRFYFTGDLKQVCVTAPAWEPQYETTLRTVEI